MSTTSPESHVVVPQVRARTPEEQRRRRWGVLGLAVAGASLFGLSFRFPYWHFFLVAPQYPKGLKFDINLTGITGDLFEIDILNHYIGMKPLSEGALLEAAMSPYIVTLVCLGVLAGLIGAGKRIGWIGLVPALGLPLGFLADTFYWMYHFGHSLSEDQPITFAPFMPTLFGEGKVGQFHTTAWPALGFWMAVAGAVLVTIAVLLRRNVCDHCPKGGTCGAGCSHLMVFKMPEKDPS